MNTECNIWLYVCVVLTSTWDKNFKWLHLMAVYCNIERTNQTRNQNHLSRLYIFHPNIHLTYVANIFACFQLDIYYSFFSLKQIKFECYVISCYIKYEWNILTKIHRYHRIKNSRNNISFVKYHFIIVDNKPILKTINMQTVLMKCGILLNILFWIPFPYSLCLIG